MVFFIYYYIILLSLSPFYQQMLTFLCQWGVSDLNRLKSEVDDLGNFRSNKLKSLQQALPKIERILSPLKSNQSLTPECSVFMFLHYYISNECCLFRIIFQDCISKENDDESTWHASVRAACKRTNEQLIQLITGETPLSKLDKVLEYLKRHQPDIASDVQIISNAPSTPTQAHQSNLAAKDLLTSALNIMQYIASLPSIVDTLDRFGIVPGSDVDFKKLKQFTDHDSSDLRLKNLPGSILFLSLLRIEQPYLTMRAS